MFQFFQKYKKIAITTVASLSVIIGAALFTWTHLEGTVEKLSKLFLGESIRVEKIEIEKKKISIQGVSMDLEGESFLQIPAVEVTRKSFFKLGEILIPEADVYLRRNKEGEWNVKRFIPESKEEEEIDLEHYKPNINLPFSSLRFSKLRFHYEDKTVEPKFEKQITFAGKLVFDSEKRISADVVGKDGKEDYKILFSNEKMPYDVFLDITGIESYEYLKAYVPTDTLQIEKGEAEVHLQINSTGNFGEIKGNAAQAIFLNKDWRQIEITTFFKGEKIETAIDYLEENEKKSAVILYDQKEKKAHIEVVDFYYDNIVLDAEHKKDWFFSFEASSEIYPQWKGTLEYKDKEKKSLFSLKSNILVTKGEYEKETKILKLYEKNKFTLFYDTEKKLLKEGEGKIALSLYDEYHGSIDFKAKDNQIEISPLRFTSKDKGGIEMKGKILLSPFAFDINYDTNHFSWEKQILEEKFLCKLALAGNVSYNKEKGIIVTSYGEIEELQYGEYNIGGLRTDMVFQENLLKLYTLENRFLFASGNLDFQNQESDLVVEIKKLKNEAINLSYPQFEVVHAFAKVCGNIKNPEVEIDLEEGKLTLVEGKENEVKGKFKISDKILSFSNAKLDQNIVSGKYDIAKNQYNIKANIIEEKFPDYYGFHDLYYRVIGEVYVKGEGAILEAKAKSTIDKIYYQNRKLPSIALEGTYSLSKKGKGNLEFSKVIFKNHKGKDLFIAKGNLNLDSEKIEAKIDRQEISFADIEEYTEVNFLKGVLSLEGSVTGIYRKPNYVVKIQGKDLSVKNAPIDYLIVNVHGDENRVILDNIESAYRNNKVKMNGYYGIAKEGYDIAIQSKNIDWSLLENLVSDYGIVNLQGKSDVDVHLRSNNSDGSFQAKNISFEIPKKYIFAKNINANIDFVGNKMKIDAITGVVNDGDIKLKGSIDLPELNQIDAHLKFLKNLSYNLNLDVDNFIYKVPDVLSFEASSNLHLAENKMRGNIELIKGYVEDIPNAYQSYWTILKEFFSKKSVATTLSKSEETSELQSNLENLLDVNVSLWIQEGIKLDIATLNVAVEELEGTVMGGLSIIGKEGKYSLLGNLELEKGSLLVNTNTFQLNKVLLSFNDNKVYLPEVDPRLILDSTVDVDGDRVRFGLQGKLEDLRFTVSSRKGNTSGNLNNLLTGNIDMTEENASYLSLLQNLIGGQLTQTVIGPVTKFIRKLFHVERFRIVSNVYSQKTGYREESQNNISVGAKIEIRDNLYKDKLYWKFIGNLYNTGVGIQQSDQGTKDNRIMDEYDFSIQYPYSKTMTFEVGVGKLPYKYYFKEEDKEKRKLNYHIGVKFEKKMYNFFDWFKE